MTRRAGKALLPAALSAALAATLAACGSQPTKTDGPASVQRVEAPAGHGRGHRRSPYAPAQEDPRTRGNYTPGGLYAPGVADSAPEGGIPDVDLIPEPEVRDEPRSRYGNRSPYTVLGRTYRVLDRADGYDETGIASYYGKKFHGRRTSNLEVYDMYAFTAAHKTLPLPSFARVTNLDNGRSVVVRVNDRGPFHDGRIIDLSYAAAVKLGVERTGTARVEVRGLSAGENAREPYDAVARSAPAASPGVAAPANAAVASPSALDALVGALPIASANAAEHPAQGRAAEALAAADAAANTDWRFNMHQDGRNMTADEFDAWMRRRKVHVATGKPGAPDPAMAAAPAAASGPGRPVAAATPAVAPAPAPTPATTRVPAAAGAGVGAGEPGIVLQVASFAAQDNAERALARLAGAGIEGARLQPGDSNGRHVWRLRIGPVAEAAEPALAARLRGLGFGPPQRVRE